MALVAIERTPILVDRQRDSRLRQCVGLAGAALNGDDHTFVVDRAFRAGRSESAPPKYDNITRLQVLGAPDLRAVRMTVDTDTAWVFGFSPLSYRRDVLATRHGCSRLRI